MKNIVLIATLALTFTACKKDKIQAPIPKAVERNIAEIKYPATPSNNRIFSYNSEGNVIKIQGTAGYWNYEYQPGKFIVKYYETGTNKLKSTTEHTIDANGRSTGSVYKTDAGQVFSNQTYEYDANGYLVKEKTVYVTGETHENHYTIVGGNAVKQMSYQNGALYDQTDYTYDDQKKAKIYFTMETTEGIKNIHGKGYANLVREFKRYNASGILSSHIKITYELDADGYIQKRFNNNELNNQGVQIEYVYQ